MTVKAMDTWLKRLEDGYRKKWDVKDGEDEKIDVNDAQMSFAAMIGGVQGGIKHYEKGVDPKMVRRMLQETEEFYDRTQDPENWEGDDAEWKYPTYDTDVYGSMVELIASLRKELEPEGTHASKGIMVHTRD